MSTTFLACAGGLLGGAGVWLTFTSLRKPRLDELLPTQEANEGTATAPTTLTRNLTRAGRRLLERLGCPGEHRRQDLELCGETVDTHRDTTLVSVSIGALVAALVLWTVSQPTSVLGAHLGLLIGGLSLIGGAMLPGLVLRKRAARERERMRVATSIMAALVNVALAGGAGVAGALTSAAARGHDPAFDRIRKTLREAHLRARPPWDALADLAERTRVDELGEFAASLHLGGTDGARVRHSVRAKSQTLGARRLAAMEASGHRNTERMTVPVLLLVLGFLLLMGFPAIHHISTGI